MLLIIFIKGLGFEYFILLNCFAPYRLLLRYMGKYISNKYNAPIHSTKRVVIIICGVIARDHSTIFFINPTFINFFDLIKYKTSILMYKVKYKLLPKTFKYYFILMKIV